MKIRKPRKRKEVETNPNFRSLTDNADSTYRELIGRFSKLKPEQLDPNIFHLAQRTAKLHQKLSRRQGNIKRQSTLYGRFNSIAEQFRNALDTIPEEEIMSGASCGDESAVGTPAIIQK